MSATGEAPSPSAPHAWKEIVYLLTFVQFISAVGFSSIFPFLSLYVEHLGTQFGLGLEFLAGAVFSAQALTMMVSAPFWGVLADRHGRKLMIERATLGGAAVVFLMSLVQSAEQLVLLRAVQGLVTGVGTALVALAAASVPRERTGYSLGLVQLGLWGGVSIGPLIGGVVADTFGFQAAFIVTSLLLFISGILVWWRIPEHFVPAPTQTKQRNSFLEEWRHVLSMPGVIAAYSSRFLNRLGRMMIIPYLPLFIQDLTNSTENVAVLTGIVTGAAGLSSSMGAIALGRIGDNIGHRQVLFGAACVACLFYIPQALVQRTWQLLGLQVLTGFAVGGIMTTISALLANYTLPGEEGAVYGLESSIMAAARAIAPLLGAGIVTWLGLRSIYAVAAVVFLIMVFTTALLVPEQNSADKQAPIRADRRSA
jgi:DHA1 family multidrug resistance protein-like MFS transporter